MKSIDMPKLEKGEIIIIKYTGPPENSKRVMDLFTEYLKDEDCKTILIEDDMFEFVVISKDQIKVE